jgi:predicted aspartyl protease
MPPGVVCGVLHTAAGGVVRRAARAIAAVAPGIALVTVVAACAPGASASAATTTSRGWPAARLDTTPAALAATAPTTNATTGSDESDLPRLYPHGDWLPLESPLLSMELVVDVVVNGHRVRATLDTGAMGTTMSEPMAVRLGVLDESTPRGAPVHAIDAHGDVVLGERLVVDAIELGQRRLQRVGVSIIGRDPDLFLIGADVLQRVDLYLAADEGLVGIFDAGGAPRHPEDVVVKARRGDRQLIVDGAADGRRRARFPLLVDTGAWNTSVPVASGVDAGLPADLAYNATTVGVGGEQEARGRFVLRPLFIGPNDTPVGRVLAVASTIDRGDGLGLLGDDVYFRFRTVISFKDAELRFRALPPRGTTRSRGRGGLPCTGDDGRPVPCVSIGLARAEGETAPGDLPGTCLKIDVDRSWAGNTVELAITAEVPGDVTLFNGGAIRAFLSIDNTGAHHCFTLWQQLERLGLRRDTPLQLRWFRADRVRWPCDPMKTRCITFTGPLAKSTAH